MDINVLRELVRKLDSDLNSLSAALQSYMRRHLSGCNVKDLLSVLASLVSECRNSRLRLMLAELMFRDLDCKYKVATLGPEGTFSHEVSLKLFSADSILLCTTIRDVIKAVRDGVTPFGVAPFENSLEGIVHETLDSLEESDSVYINMCIEHRVNFCIAVSDDVRTLDDVELLYANPYAYQQCRNNVRALLRNVKSVIYVSSTAESARAVRESRKAACIVSKSCALLYGLRIAAEHVEDQETYTKFVLLSRTSLSEGDRTGLIFTIPHRPGSLYSVLEVFARRGINLTMIYSRPTRKRPWQYYFYLEFEGSLVEDLERELSRVCHSLRPLGSYLVTSSY